MPDKLNNYRILPLILGTIEAVIDDTHGVIQSSTGAQFRSRVSKKLDPKDTMTGTRCDRHPKSFRIV